MKPLTIKRISVIVAGILTITFLGIMLHHPKSVRSPVTISHYRFTLSDMSRNPIGSPQSTYPDHAVWVSVQIEQADHWIDTSTNRPSLFGNQLIPSATLKASDGTSLPLFEARTQVGEPFGYQLKQNLRLQYLFSDPPFKYYMIYGFDNERQLHTANFAADVHIPAYDINNNRTPDQPPFVRPLRFDNLSLP